MFPVVTLKREYDRSATTGVMTLPSGLNVYTLELPYRDNLPNVSCLPPGVYRAKWLARSASGKYKRVWHIQNVPGRTGILIHAANFLHQLQGCIAPGVTRGNSDGLPCVWNSGAALNKIREELEGRDFLLRIGE